MLLEFYEKNDITPCLFPFEKTSKLGEIIRIMKLGEYEKVKIRKKLTIENLKKYSENTKIRKLLTKNR